MILQAIVLRILLITLAASLSKVFWKLSERHAFVLWFLKFTFANVQIDNRARVGERIKWRIASCMNQTQVHRLSHWLSSFPISTSIKWNETSCGYHKYESNDFHAKRPANMCSTIFPRLINHKHGHHRASPYNKNRNQRCFCKSK